MSTEDYGLDSILSQAEITDDTDKSATGATRTRKERSDKGVPRSTRTGTRRKVVNTAELVDDLMVPWARVASGLAFTSPTTSAVLLSRGQATITALMKIASDHPRMMEAMKKAAKFGPATELLDTGVAVVIAFGVDIGRIPPTSPIAVVSGVTELYAQVHNVTFAETPMPEQSPGTPYANGFMPSPSPPTYSTGMAS